MRGWSAARYRSQLVAPCFPLCSAAFLKPSPGFLKLEYAGESPGGLAKAQIAAPYPRRLCFGVPPVGLF